MCKSTPRKNRWREDTGDCPGAFGEANKELDPLELVHRLAKLAAKTTLGQMLAPKTSQSGKYIEKVIRMRFRLIPRSAICKSKC
jgi:hypothetical protein